MTDASTDPHRSDTDPSDPSDMVIVLAVADDESSWKAADFAARVAGDHDTVIVVNVASDHAPLHRRAHELRDLDWLGYAALVLLPPVAPVMPPVGSDDDEDDPVAEAISLPASVADDDLVVTHGDPVKRICELAAQVEADLIVVGTSDPSVWSRMFSGESISRGVVDHAPCSVLVVR